MARSHEFVTEFMAAFDIAAAYGRHLYYSGARPWLVTRQFCSAAERALIVQPGGGLSACYEVSNSGHPLSEDFQFGTLSGAGEVTVSSKRRLKLAAKLDERREHCAGCSSFHHCAGDCPTRALGPDGNQHLQFGERCEINRAITRELLARYIERGGGVWRHDGAADRVDAALPELELSGEP